MGKIVIADLDHTVCDAAWRDPLIGKWDEYYDAQKDDKPIEYVLDILKALHAHGHLIYAVTARPEYTRNSTLLWLAKHEAPIENVFMREKDDHRPSTQVKCDIVREHFIIEEVAFVLEDRDDCTAAYREMGLNVLQVCFWGGKR